MGCISCRLLKPVQFTIVTLCFCSLLCALPGDYCLVPTSLQLWPPAAARAAWFTHHTYMYLLTLLLFACNLVKLSQGTCVCVWCSLGCQTCVGLFVVTVHLGVCLCVCLSLWCDCPIDCDVLKAKQGCCLGRIRLT